MEREQSQHSTLEMEVCDEMMIKNNGGKVKPKNYKSGMSNGYLFMNFIAFCVLIKQPLIFAF